MATRGEAEESVLAYLEEMSEGGLRLVLLPEATIEEDFGWVFFYDSAEFVEEGVQAKRLAGNAPVIVDRRTGKLFATGTAYPVEYYIDNFRRFGHPYGDRSGEGG